MLLTILYLVITAYNIDRENLLSKEIEKIVVCSLIFICLSFELILSINRVDYLVSEVDNKIKSLIESFKPHEQAQKAEERTGQWLHSFKPLQDTKEFSFYQNDCFTSAMRKGPTKFIEIPNNTLAEGDIIRLLPGDIAPAFIELKPFDLETRESNQSR